MKLVVDTNIVFSALLNTDNVMIDILLNPLNSTKFFSPYLLIDELHRYSKKLILASSLSSQNLAEATGLVISRLSFISEELISDSAWKEAYDLCKEIDETDTPFVALAFDLDCKLWTGDKKLAKGLREKGFDLIISSSEINFR